MSRSDGIRMDFGFSPAAAGESARELRSRPFRILILGDFSGRANRRLSDPATLASRRIIPLDCDNIDQLPGELGAALQLPSGQPADRQPADAGLLSLSFGELEDFHPDRLFERVEVFARLRQLRRQLQNTSTFAAAARELSAVPGVKLPADPAVKQSDPPDANAPRGAPPAGASAPPASSPIAGSLLDAALAATEDAAPAAALQSSYGASTGSPLVDELVREVVAPYVVPAADPRQPELVASVDAATGELMNRLLHHPAFQELEANWRSVQFLTRRLEIDSRLQVSLVDVARSELEADLDQAPEPASSGCARLLGRPAASGTTAGAPWSLIVGCYQFDADEADLRLLSRLGELAQQAGAPLLAGAHARLAGSPSFGTTPDVDDWAGSLPPAVQEAWDALRQSPQAAFLGLATPRCLLRAPYGKKTSGTDQFKYEELPGVPQHEHFLWGNSAFLCACTLGSAVNAEDDVSPDAMCEIDGLPLFTFTDDDGDKRALPCAEAALLDRAVERIAERGLIAIRSVRGRDAVQVTRLRSLSSDGQSINGRW